MTMSITLSGILAAAIYDAAHGERERAIPGVVRAVDLLARVTGGAAVVLVSAPEGRLAVNGEEVRADAPGAGIILAAMVAHDIAELRLPAGLFVPQWESVAALLATSPELWTAPDGMAEAMRQAVPGVTLVRRAGSAVIGSHKMPERSDAATGTGTDELRTVVRAASQAVSNGDWVSLDAAIVQLEEIAASSGKHLRPIITDERNRLFTPSVLADLVREMATDGATSPAGRALARTGEPGIQTVIERLATGPARAARRACMDWLVSSPDATPALFHALSQPGTTLLRDVAEVVGRRGSDGAVGLLAPLLSHDNEEVRAAAWRALEDIGTPAAIAALQPRR